MYFRFSARCQYITLLLRPRQCPCDLTTLSQWPWCVASKLDRFVLGFYYTHNISQTTTLWRSHHAPAPVTHYRTCGIGPKYRFYSGQSISYGWRNTTARHVSCTRTTSNTSLPSRHHAKGYKEEKYKSKARMRLPISG